MSKYKGKYRNGSHRMPYWDYSSEAFYFLTIVVQNRICHLGEIIQGKMILLPFGKIVQREFLRSFDIRRELWLHEYIIMPNHIHTIVEIRHSDSKTSVETDKIYFNKNRNNPFDIKIADSCDLFNPQAIHNIKRNPPIRLPKSISSFIAGFKSSVNTQIDNYIDEHQLDIKKFNKNNHFFQPNYHDHIIRNNSEFQRIKYYIIHNPKNWENDKLTN